MQYTDLAIEIVVLLVYSAISNAEKKYKVKEWLEKRHFLKVQNFVMQNVYKNR